MSYGTLWVIMSLMLLFSFISSRIMFHRGTISRAPFMCVGHDSNLVGANPIAGIYR